MAIQPKDTLLSYLGFVQWGDLAELTLYRRPDGRLVIFKKTHPDKPPSALQLTQRWRFQQATAAYKRLSLAQRAQWDFAADRASLNMHGYNLFLSTYLLPDPSAQATIARQTRTTLTH